MDSLEIAQRYFEAWNQRDGSAVLKIPAEGGTYSDPTTGGPLSGETLVAYVQGLVSAFPDVSFEIVSSGLIAPDLVAAQWVMRGTNLGSMNGLPPTGKSIELHGADFIRVEESGVSSVEGYFDAGVVPRQLGLQVVVQPTAIGPFSFGESIRASTGNTTTPGAFSITWLEARSEEEKQKVQEAGQKVVTEMLSMPGFISWVGVSVGDCMMTITAWETPDAVAPLMKGGEHRSAVGRFFSPEIAAAAVSACGYLRGLIPAGFAARRVRRWLIQRSPRESAHAVRTCLTHFLIGSAGRLHRPQRRRSCGPRFVLQGINQ